MNIGKEENDQQKKKKIKIGYDLEKKKEKKNNSIFFSIFFCLKKLFFSFSLLHIQMLQGKKEEKKVL